MTQVPVEPGPSRRRLRWRLPVILSGLVVLAVLLAYLQLHNDPTAQIRADAVTAVRTLKTADLESLEGQLADYRGNLDFAYFFTSAVTPRDLGDALGAATGSSGAADQTDPDAAYETELADLAGTLSLATHGSGDRALPELWTADFIKATTTPSALYREDHDASTDAGIARADQDEANGQSLLLLLSRGYWSTDFLKAATAAYWDFDHSQGGSAWPLPQRAGAKYAAAPGGKYLTDGILALTAALTANPVASAWAFTAFQPGTEAIEGSGQQVGKFTHYLFFEHRFSSGSSTNDGIGMTAALTALSAAIDVLSDPVDAQTPDFTQSQATDTGPLHDAIVLRNVAANISNDSRCSWNPSDYWNCVVIAAQSVWHFAEAVVKWVTQAWGQCLNSGHCVLDILSLTTFAPPPFSAVGFAAAAVNATWYAIDGDYLDAGLSLALAVPGLAFVKIAKSAKAGVDAERVAANAERVAQAAKEVRTGAETADASVDVLTVKSLAARPAIKPAVRNEVFANAPKDAAGHPIDPNTGKAIVGNYDVGHKPGYEYRCTVRKAIAQAWTMAEIVAYENDPSHYQIEDPSSNRSHQHEAPVCAS
ncbi:MAG: hypothetical protein LCH96_02335 [Actinobacteria bacterium]|nr:hypothetical protein [Actinomycetota bacterium]